jgi:hypothetical protein
MKCAIISQRGHHEGTTVMPDAGACRTLGHGQLASLDNATYNLMEPAAHICKGLHRYETFKADAQGCQECEGLRAGMQRSDEQQLERIVSHLKAHFAQGADTKAKAA